MRRPDSDLQPVAFWLVPSEEWHERLGRCIAELAAVYQGPAFEPHITLDVGQAPAAQASLAAMLERVAARCAPMALTAGATAHSAAHFKTLYVEFDDPRPLALQQALRAEFGSADYLLDPHLSLLYHGNLAPEVREHLAATQRFEGEEIGFDTLVVVREGAPGATLADIETLDTSLRCTLEMPPRGE